MSANHVYRVIWSEVLNAWVAVSEITRSHGQRSRGVLQAALPALLFSGYALAADVPTTVVPTGTGTSAYVSANGVPVVNIKAANAAGLSHNQYLRYDVETRGLVLNNGNLSKIERSSQLAGRVLANPNLASEASIILNEVVSTNRSLLAGFTEVVGGRADVVLANPNGITCSGCGFINTDRATLTTGTPFFGGTGGLGGFNVERGDILVQGSGVNASAQQILDLVARSIKVEAPVVTSATGTLQLTAGTNRWSYDSREVTGSVPGSGPVPTYAIDSSALGGMYAGRIRLIATEAGVGVRMLGEAAASVDDFSITSAGQVVIQARLSAARDLALTSSASGVAAIAATDSSLSAGRDLGVSVANGGLTLAGGVLTAANNFDINVGTLTDTATSALLTDNNKRYAENNLTLTATDAVTLDGVTYYGNNVRFTAAGDLQFGTAAVRADQAVNVTSTGGSITNAGRIYSAGDLEVTAQGSVSNAATGGMAGLGTFTLTATTGNIDNAGLLFAGTQLTASSLSGIFHNQLTGEIRSGGGMTLSADTFINNNFVEAVQDITINTTTSFRNEVVGGAPVKSPDWGTLTTSAIRQIFYDEESSCLSCNELFVREDSVYVKEKLDSPLSDTNLPQIVAGRDLIINYGGGSAANIGSLLSAGNNIEFNGTGIFSNAAIGLETLEYRRRWFLFIGRAYDDSIDDYAYVAAMSQAQFESVPEMIGSDSDLTYPHGNSWSYWGGTSYNAENDTYNQKARNAAFKNYYGVVPGATVALRNSSIRAGGALLGNVGSLVNEGSPYSASNAGNLNLPGGVPALPTNPNGYFIPAGNSSARYLIETNPLYIFGSSFGGSDYLIEWLGMDPESTMKRLGDANYEAYLIRQQLISQTGSNVLNGYGSEANQMKRLMDQAVGESKALGLTFGKAPSADQLASLTRDIVWMVETTVSGQTVLAPVVYLAPSSRQSIMTGAVIAGSKINLNVASLSNRGGTISSTGAMTVVSQGDITNTSGTIKGGDVTLKSTEGSIVNRTLTEGYGDQYSYKTIVGEKATIEATGSLALESKQDIEIRGADLKAGWAASLTAGRAITVDTVVDKTATSSGTEGSAGILIQTGPSISRVTTERNIASTIVTGGGLTLKSGEDTTLAGTKAEIGGNLSVDSGGDFNILSRQDKTTTYTETRKSGIGVGGGLWGSEKTTTEDFTGTNFGSSISVGGNADIKAGQDMTLQGSDLKIGGDGKIDARAVKIEQGLDEKRTVTTTETEAFLTMGSSTDSNASAQAAAGSGRAAAEASAGASASASESSEFNLYEKRTTTVDHSKSTGVASNLTTGGNLDIKAREAVTVQGSNVESVGNLSIDAQRIDVLAGRNEETTTTTTSASKVGIYTDSKAEAKADAGASATGMSATARAGASASAEAGSTVTFGTRMEDSTEQTTAITHTASSLKSGGDMSLKAAEEAKFVGSKVESAGNLAIEAKDITSLAAQDSTVTTSSSTTRTAGIYLEGEASAKAGAEARVGPTGTKLEAGAEAGAEASAGLRYAQEDKRSEQGSSTSVVSTFKAGGDITRKATGTITDQGTQLEAGGNITQSATTLKEIAAEDKTWSSKSTESHDGRVGVYAGASASTEGGGDASAGVKGKYTYGQSSAAQMDTTAVTSRYKAGGSISSTTTDKTTLIGTQFEAGKDVSISAGSLDYQAARDTHTSSSSSKAAEGEVKAKLVGSAGAELSGSYDQSSSSSASSTARAGGITAGGNVTVRTQGDARFEGTDISAGEKAKVESTAGNVVFDAAKSTSSEQSSGFNVSAKLGTSTKAGEGGKGSEKSSEGALGGGYSSSSASSTTSKAATLRGRDVEVSAGRDVTMEGTQVQATNDASVTAGGTVKLLEAKDSVQSSSFGIQGGAKASSESKPESDKSSQSAKLDVKVANEDRQTGKATKIESGGNLTVKGAAITSQQAELSAGGKATVQGPVQQLQKTNVDKGMKVDVGISASRKTETAKKDSAKTQDGKPAAQAKKPKTKKKRTTTPASPAR